MTGNDNMNPEQTPPVPSGRNNNAWLVRLGEEARREILPPLLKLNHERYEKEVAQGLRRNKKETSTLRKKKTSLTKDNNHPDLFGELP